MINFNVSPYYDSFDESEKYYRILFKPSLAIQARELTGAQSGLQNQIKKFGDAIYADGAMVSPGFIQYDATINYQKINSVYGTPPNDIEIDPNNFLGYTLIGSSSGVEGIIINVAPANTTDPITFMAKLTNAGNNNSSTAWWDGEVLYRKDDNTIQCVVQGVLNTTTPAYTSSGKGSIASISAGVYYVHGLFIQNDSQSIILDKYSTTPTCSVGLRIIESVVTADDDTSLTDNAQGSPNYAAPGADRYKIDLKLEYVTDDSGLSDDFIVLQILKDGILLKQIRTTQYSELEKTFARRTYDQSGNYTVNPFSVTMHENLRVDGDPIYGSGAFYAADGGDASKLVAQMGTGIAYVQGFECRQIANTDITLDKGRDIATEKNTVTNFSLGNYVIVNQVYNIPRIDTFGVLNLYETTAVTPGTNNGDLTGTARVRALKNMGAVSYLYLFDVQMVDGKNFESDVKWIYDTSGSGTNNFTCATVLDSSSTTTLQNPSSNVLLFHLPNNVMYTLSVDGAGVNTTYDAMRAYFNVGIVSNSATLTAKDNEVFQQNIADYFVSYTADGSTVSAPTFSFSGSPTGKILTIGNLSGPINVLAPIVKMVIAEKTKYFHNNGSIIITSPNKIPNGRDYLGTADIIILKSVYMSNDFNTTPTTSSLDITSRYQLDNGQRDNYYDEGSIVLSAGQSAPTGQIMVLFNYYTHSAGDYFSIDSYTGLDRSVIPVYASSESGGMYALADCLDFRPRKSDDGTGFVNTGAIIGELPEVFTDIRSDYQYYLNRIDFVYMDIYGNFQVARGTSADSPSPPVQPSAGMVLYQLYIPAYTFKSSDVVCTPQYTRRYTMADIGTLDQRISNLEYYTALSLLEQQTSSMEILDQNGLNRFKNGFIVDPFSSQGVGDTTNSDYNCSIDPNNKLMRAKYNNNNIGLVYDPAHSSGVQLTGSIITLPYTDIGINSQIYASKYENINPFAFRNIFGNISFEPNCDVWSDTTTLPSLVVNDSPDYAALKAIADATGSLNGITWGSWQNVGSARSSTSYTSSSSSVSVVKQGEWGNSPDPAHPYWTGTTTTTSVTANTTTQQNQQRTGTQVTPVDAVVNTDLGSSVKSASLIPYMRSIPILLKTDQLKKNTKVYPFFDGKAVSTHCVPPSINDYCKPADKIYFASFTGNFDTSNGSEEFIVGALSGASATVCYQTTSYIHVINVIGTFTVGETVTGVTSGATLVFSSITPGNLGDEIITGDNGEVVIIFTIPNDNNLQFLTGSRDFVLNDENTNSDPSQTYAKGTFTSNGLSVSQQDTILSTKTINFQSQTLTQSQTVSSSSSSTSTSVSSTGWWDPLAQSFLITETGGCFVTKVRVWFQSTDESEGVTCQIRNMVNGYPSEIVMAETTLFPPNIPSSESSPGAYTDFIFPEPIYLMENTSYAFVLKPTVSSANYNVWVGENGRTDIASGTIITGNPAAGSLFESNNASTWIANENEDIMFSLFKAVFNTSDTGIVQLVNDNIVPASLGTNPLETYVGQNVVRVYYQNHGLTVGSIFNLGGLVPANNYNGFLGSQLNGSQTVTRVELDNFTFSISGTSATDSGLTGGTGLYGSFNYSMDTAHPLVNQLLVNGVDVSWTMATTSSTAVGGSQTPYVTGSFKPIINNTDVHMSAPMMISSPYNETSFLGGKKSLFLLGNMSSSNPNISPVVDIATSTTPTDYYRNNSTSTMTAVSNRIDNPTITSWAIGTSSVFNVAVGENEIVVTHTNHGMATGAYVNVSGWSDAIPGTTFNPNGWNCIRVVDQNSYIIDMTSNSTSGYSGSGGGVVILEYSTSHFKYCPEVQSFGCSAAARYMTKQVTLDNTAENFKLSFSAVNQQNSSIDVYYKIKGPYETTLWNNIDWIYCPTPDSATALSQNETDFKDFAYTIENIPQYNAISVKLVMRSIDSSEVPIFSSFTLVCTT